MENSFVTDLQNQSEPEQEDCSSGIVPVGNKKTESSVDEREILVPVLTSMRKFLFQNYRLTLYSYLNRSLRNGSLESILWFHFANKVIDRRVCSFGNPAFWRVDRETFIANVGVTLCLDTGKGFRSWDGFLSLWFHMGEKVTCSIEYLGAMDELADEELPMLSSYLVPILSNRQMDEEAEAIWARYLPEALRDSEKRSAVTLAKKMGLTIQYQPVYRHKDTASILFFEEGELTVKDELAENASETKPTCVKIPANTIVINTNAVQQRYAGFHIYHECVHFEEHTQEQIDAADSIDLVAYAQSRGYELVREGNQYRMKEHDSLYLKDNHWYWFSHQLGGKAISFLMQYEGCGFVEAMQTLLGEKDINERPLPKASEISAREPEPFELPTPSENSKAAYAYLCQRGISLKIISQYMKEGLIYQTNSFAYTDENGERAEKKCPAQVVFVGKDKDGEPKYACTRACFNEGKHDAPGSNKAYAFSIPAGENCKSVWVFESAIDLLSHMTLCSYSKKQYPAHRVSLGGCSPVALQRYLIDHPEIEYVNLGLDNDEQGRNAAENIKDLLKDSYKVYDHTPTFGKDFNEDLMHRQEQYRESHKEKDDPELER